MTLTDERPGVIPDTAVLSRFCDELAEGARKIALTYFRSPVAYERKADLSPVTVADQAIEAYLRDRIQERFPDHGIVGEEAEEKAGTRFTWYIDPIDGTKSFISGMPLFGILVALYDTERRTPVVGMIDMPALDERWIGDGSATYLNGKRVHASNCESIGDAQIYTSSPDMFSSDEWVIYDRLSRRAAFRRFGGDCYLYALLASGFCDLVVEMSLKPFDFMALIPVIEGAGGVIRDWKGAVLTPSSDGRVVAAATEKLLQHALADTAGAGARPS
jgi:histidinol phosphatase-like enzyme (inositol monophosphatase family)